MTSRFPDEVLYAAATRYYLEDRNQSQVAAELGTSRATVSRLLAEARRRGIVKIEVVPPAQLDGEELADHTARTLGLHAVHLCPPIRSELPGPALASALGPALTRLNLQPGDAMLISSGRTMHAVSLTELPTLPGVVVVPTIGGHDEPDSWYQPNEIIRQFAARVGGTPRFIFAPAMPSAALYDSLINDADMRDVLSLWNRARCAVLGVGAPPLSRDSLPRFVTLTPEMRSAVGDVCSRFYDNAGKPLPFPGSEHLIATALQTLHSIPVSIAVAYGPSKIAAIVAGAAAGYFNELVTDTATAERCLKSAADWIPGREARVAYLPGDRVDL